MKLTKSNSNFVPAPEGTTQAVLADIVDMGQQEDIFNPGTTVHKMRFVFQTEDTMEDGKRFIVSTFPLTASINPKSNVYKIVKVLLGRDTEPEDYDENGDIDLDALLIGKNAMITIVHKEKGEKVYANIENGGVSAVPSKIKDRLEVTDDYVRVKDRTDGTDFNTEELEKESAKSATASAGGKGEDEDLNY